MSLRIAIAGLLLWPLLALPARAQELDMSQGGPVTVTARDGIDWDQNSHEVIAHGNARAVRGNVTVDADRLIAYYRKKTEAPGAAGAKPAAPAPAPAPGTPAATGDADTGRRPRATCASTPRPIRRRATARSTTWTRRCW
jgi:lipopolysaccharide export system protein LptA